MIGFNCRIIAALNWGGGKIIRCNLRTRRLEEKKKPHQVETYQIGEPVVVVDALDSRCRENEQPEADELNVHRC